MSPALIPFNIDGLTPEAGTPAAERLIGGRPSSRTWNLYTSPDNRFFSGIWESDPGAWRIEYTEHEFCHIIEGISRITPEGGEPLTVKAGDAFTIPAGFRGSWEVVERTRKHYAIYEA